MRPPPPQTNIQMPRPKFQMVHPKFQTWHPKIRTGHLNLRMEQTNLRMRCLERGNDPAAPIYWTKNAEKAEKTGFCPDSSRSAAPMTNRGHLGTGLRRAEAKERAAVAAGGV